MAKLKIRKRAPARSPKAARNPAPAAARIRRRARRNPTSVVTSSGSSSAASDWAQVGAGGGAYVGGRVAGNIGGALGNKWKGNRRGGKVLAAGALIALAYYLPRKFPQFRKYRTAMLTGAVIAFVQAVVEEFAPKLGTLLGFKAPQLAASPAAQAQIQAIQQEQRRIYANRTTVAHPDDAVYDRIEAQQFTQPAPRQQYVPAQPQEAAQAQGEDSGFEFEDEEAEDYGQGAGGIFDVN